MSEQQKILSREDILGARDTVKELVDMNKFGWGGSVYVQGMTGLQRGLHENDMLETNVDDPRINKARFRAGMLVYCIVDGEGNQLFREQDVDALNEKNAAALDYLYDKAAKASGYRPADIEEITKNLPSGQEGGSS